MPPKEQLPPGLDMIKPQKAYKNPTFLASPAAKPVRFLCELLEPEERLAREKVKNTILIFGSARAKHPEDHAKAVESAKVAVERADELSGAKDDAQRALDRLERTAWMSEYFLRIRELSRRLTEWSLGRRDAQGAEPYVIATGGGPGMMEAANAGAAQVPGARSIGIGISLPFEPSLNPYCSPALSFELHYFATRKFWLVHDSAALVVAPGGIGTLDELAETMTLLQTGKIGGRERRWKRQTPIVMFGARYWKRVVNFQAAVDMGTMSQSDVDRLYFTDSVEDAFQHVTEGLLRVEAARDGELADAPPSKDEWRRASLAHLSGAARLTADDLATWSGVRGEGAPGSPIPGQEGEGEAGGSDGHLEEGGPSAAAEGGGGPEVGDSGAADPSS